MDHNNESLLQNKEVKQRERCNPGRSDEPLIKPNGEENLDKDKDAEKEKNKFWTEVIVLFLFIDIFLVIVISLSFTTPRVQSQRQTVVQWDHNVCFPCKDVYLTDDDKTDNIYDFDVREDGNLCCAGRERNLIDIVTKFAETQYQKERAKHSELRVDGENDRSAYLREIDWVRSEGQTILHWKQNSSFIGKKMMYKDGRIQVKTPGTCFIYAHLVFVNNQTQDVATSAHSIWLRNGGKHEEKLLELFQSQCVVTSSATAGFTPTYQGALFELKADDSIELRVQNSKHLEKDNNKHNFGIYCFQ